MITQRSLSALIAPPSDLLSPQEKDRLLAAAPENVARITAETGAGETLKRWLGEGILVKERRPSLWIYRQFSDAGAGPLVVNLLIGLVRVQESSSMSVELPEEAVPAEMRAKRVGFLGETHADFEPSLLLTRAPLAGALATTRQPDVSATDERGVRHDALRILDFAQHVDLQGRAKNVEAVLASGLDRFDAARQFAKGPAATKLPGAKYKLCAILDEAELGADRVLPVPYSGLFAFSLEDPVY